MISTSVDQLLKHFVPGPDGRPPAAETPRFEGPPFAAQLRRAGSSESSSPAASPPQADSGERGLERRSSTDAEPPADGPVQNNAPPAAPDSAVRDADKVDRRQAAPDDSDNIQPQEPDEPAAATAAAANGQPAILIAADAATTLADATLVVKQSPAAENALLAENVEPQSERAAEQVVESADQPAADEVAAAESDAAGSVVVVVDPAADEVDVAGPTRPNVKPQPNIADPKPTGDQNANDGADAAETDDAPKVDVKISRGGRPDADDSTAAAHELPEADVDASETSADVDGTDRRRGVLPVHQTTSVERAGRPSQSPRAAEQAGERSAASTAVSADAVEQEPAANADEPDRELSAAKNPDESNDPRRPDEATADNRPQSARPRPIAGPRGLAAQSAAAASAELNLSNAAAASPTDAASEREANRTATVTKDSLLSTFDRFDRHNSLANRGVHRGDGGQETPHVDPARFVSRVARAIHTAQERGGPLQLRLSPPELGSLRLEIAVRQGVLTASVETETTTARQLLLENLPVLRDRLAEQNVRIERFDVDVRRDGGEQPRFGPQHQDHQPPRHTATQNRGGQQHGPGGNDAPAEPAPRRTITDTSINVIA